MQQLLGAFPLSRVIEIAPFVSRRRIHTSDDLGRAPWRVKGQRCRNQRQSENCASVHHRFEYSASRREPAEPGTGITAASAVDRLVKSKIEVSSKRTRRQWRGEEPVRERETARRADIATTVFPRFTLLLRPSMQIRALHADYNGVSRRSRRKGIDIERD